jgi:two-component system response regulator YesN
MLVSRREAWKRQLEIRGTDESFWTRLSGVANLKELAALLAGDIVGGRDESTGGGAVRPELRKAQKIIRREYREPLTLDSVAEEVGWSPSYLSRVMSQETGKTFKEHLTETRVAKAMDILRMPGVKVYEVAEQVGFPSYRQFSVVFKGLTGLRPKEFQKGGGYEA